MTKFKTATELGITEAEHVALQAVAIGLANGDYVHHQGSFSGEGITGRMFDMAVPFESEECGSVGCIGGWVATEMGFSICSARSYVSKSYDNHSLYQLFYPNQIHDWDNITPAIAAEAIYIFLQTGMVDYAALLDDAA